MQYINGIVCLVLSIMFYLKPDFFTNNINVIFGFIFMLLANLFIKKEDRE